MKIRATKGIEKRGKERERERWKRERVSDEERGI